MDPQPQRAWREACGTVLAESFSRGLIRGFQSVSRFSTRMQIMVLTWCACIEMEMICWWNTVSRQEGGGSMKHLIRFASIALVCGLLACLTGCSCSSTRQEAQKEPVPRSPMEEPSSSSMAAGSCTRNPACWSCWTRTRHGYSWTSAIEGSTLALYTEKTISAEEAYPAEDANRVGAEGSHLFSFKGMAAGDGTIALSYERSWEQTDDDKKIVLQVKTARTAQSNR